MSEPERKCVLCGDPAEWVSSFHRADAGLCRPCQLLVAKPLAENVAVDDLFRAWNAVHLSPPIVITNIVNS